MARNRHLVTGTIALLWVWVLLRRPCGDSLAGCWPCEIDSKAFVALFVPFAYILGMAIDFISRGVTATIRKRILPPLQQLIHRKIPCRFNRLKEWFRPRDEKDAPLSQQAIMLASTDLGKQLEMRSSRDRVARGAFLNAVISTLVLWRDFSAQSRPPISPGYVLLGGVVLSLILFRMWHRFHRLTHKYRRKAGKAILRKNPG
jgi:hypothetical protein